uniref:Uncharacterized protein n=1 Tax=Ailuropoda melanoleuca TaxID=9646 RepID=A0A7N5J8T6_AILME
MRYNEKELQALSRQPAELAAELGMRGPKKGSVLARGNRQLRPVVGLGGGSEWEQTWGLLPLQASWRTRRGSITLNAAVRSNVRSGWGLSHTTFSPSYDYEFMRRSLIFYRNEIQKMTGKDPLEQFGISEEARFQLGGLKA